MSYPLGVVTRTITVGDSITVESGTDLTVRATLRSSRGLVWIATGERAVSAPEVRESAAAGDAVTFTPPVTDQSGWRDLATGALIDVSAPNAHTHTYTIELKTLRDGRPVNRRVIGPFPLPKGDGSQVDADLLIEADTVPGLLVSVPDSWGGMVAQAVAAAEEAAKVAEAAALDYFAANPPPAGDDGREVELRTSATHIQWRLEGDSTWLDIIELADLVGASGPAVELRTTATNIQWRSVDAVTWTDLVLLESLRGPAGREVELQTTATHIQWRYVGSPTWTDLVSLASITGDDGLSVELQTTATHIQWRLVGGAWANLVSLSALVGPAGPPNTLAIGTVTTGAPGSAAAASVTGAAPSQVLNLTIPAGATGAVSAWEYYAAGRPDIPGTLDAAALAWRNAAPSGATFYSTDGPQGAWVWRKRGTVWTCVEGDTGPIDLTPKLNSGWTVTLATWQRINSVVYLRIEGAQGSTAGNIISGLPNALRSAGGNISWRQGTGSATVIRPAAWYIDGQYIGGPVIAAGVASLIDGISTSSFAWPTTLTI